MANRTGADRRTLIASELTSDNRIFVIKNPTLPGAGDLDEKSFHSNAVLNQEAIHFPRCVAVRPANYEIIPPTIHCLTAGRQHPPRIVPRVPSHRSLPFR